MTQSSYLPEDKDLLDELESIGPMSTGTALAEQERKINVVQIKAILRSRKSAKDFDVSTTRYSLILLTFAIAQCIIGVFQLLLMVVSTTDVWARWAGIGTLTLFGAVLFYFFRKFDQLFEEIMSEKE